MTEQDGRITYHRSIPDHLRELVKLYCSHLHFLIPGWSQSVTVSWTTEQEHAEDGGASVAASCYSRKDYRWSTITLTNDWLTGDAYTKLEELVHEFVHITERESFVYAADLLDHVLDKDDPQAKFIKEGLRKQHESLTQDLARCITNRIWPDVRKVVEQS